MSTNQKTIEGINNIIDKNICNYNYDDDGLNVFSRMTIFITIFFIKIVTKVFILIFV